ncbi:hypothetical protein [Clostridium cavendishii]|uniref:hypothetical protein n=1 Tax=Clostridium cavendishii TaxID=349931 RepID=UPI001160A155|nr:hypothetical protein [Clostridium cavendishii]
MDEKFKKRALALSVAAAVVTASPLYQEGTLVQRVAIADETDQAKQEKFYEEVAKKFEKGDAYHGTGQVPFLFPNESSGGSYVYTGRSFSGDSWRSWTTGDKGVYSYSSSHMDSSSS